jgi:hypothetical protein
MPAVVQEFIGIADFDVFRGSRQIIDQQVIRTLHVMSLQKYKASGHRAETFRIDPINHVHATLGAELQKSGRDGLHVF